MPHRLEAEIALATLPKIGDAISEKYVVENAIGQGAMGVVYKARHLLTGKTVAVKVLQPHVAANKDLARRFLQEARASARIAHRNIVDTYDAGEWNGLPYLVMEYLEGTSLDAYLRIRGPLSLEHTLRILAPVCAAVHASHRAGVIHRDLKPENIFLCRDEANAITIPKVLDFGVSKITGPDQANVTATGNAVGTARYMPLEQMTGSRGISAAADVYALAVIIYECLTGTFPYEATTVPQLAIQMSNSSPVPLGQRRSDLPREFCDVVMKALEKDVDRRIANVPDLIAALAPWRPPTESENREVREELGASTISSDFDSGTVSIPPARLDRGVASLPPLRSERPVSEVRPARDQPSPPPVAAPAEPRANRTRRFAVLAIVAVVFGSSVAWVEAYRARHQSTPSVPVRVSAPPIETRPTFARLRVSAVGRPGASIRIDATDRGTLDRDGVLELSIPSGEHFVELVVRDLVIGSGTVSVRSGEVGTVDFPATDESTDEPVAPEVSSEPSSRRSPRARDADEAPRTSTSTSPAGGAVTESMRSVRVQGEFEANPY